MKINPKNHLIAFSLLFLLAALIFAPAVTERQEAKACWNNELIECFSNPVGSWPWCIPQGSGRCWGGDPLPRDPQSWGIQDRVYSSTFDESCGNDVQSIWCIGGSRNFDPDVNPYLRNMDSYVTYGPLDLSTAVNAIVRFQLLCESEFLGDSIFWGAADDEATYIDTSFSGSTLQTYGTQWYWIEMDLSDLHDADGNPASVIGANPVTIFWWFHSDADLVDVPPLPLDNGAFIDNVLIEWDDGFIDYTAAQVAMLHEDSTNVTHDLVVNDVVRNSFRWSTCAGLDLQYPDVQITVTARDPIGFDEIVFDSVFTNVVEDSVYENFTDTWVVENTGNYIITVEIDPLDEHFEANEDNNDATTTVYAWPPNPHPEFTWLAPGTESELVSDDVVMLKWTAYDIGEEAYFSIYYDDDSEGCSGAQVPGGAGIAEHDGMDSLEWDISAWSYDNPRWPYILLWDSQWDTCIYAPNPVVRRDLAAQELPIGIPSELFLAQNYPNPFNPNTEISFGITRAGLVTLRVYDLLGRQVAELVNETLSPGTYVSHFNGRDLSSGVYLYTLTSEEGIMNNKMVLLK